MFLNQFVSEVALLAGITKKDAKNAINATFQVIEENLVNGDGKLTVIGFGTLEVKIRPAQMGRNPRTGETMMVPARKQLRFKMGTSLKRCLRESAV